MGTLTMARGYLCTRESKFSNRLSMQRTESYLAPEILLLLLLAIKPLSLIVAPTAAESLSGGREQMEGRRHLWREGAKKGKKPPHNCSCSQSSIEVRKKHMEWLDWRISCLSKNSSFCCCRKLQALVPPESGPRSSRLQAA